MKHHAIMAVLLCSLAVWSEEIGDFAPLAPGNVWIYKDVTIAGVMSIILPTDSVVIAITLKESVPKGDSVGHYFNVQTSSYTIQRLLKTDAGADAAVSGSSSSEAVLWEVNNRIVYGSGWPSSVFLPAFSQHTADSSKYSDPHVPLGLPYGTKIYRLQKVDGVYTYSVKIPSERLAGEDTPSYFYSYRQDTGFVSYSYSKHSTSASTVRKVTLLSFSTATPESVAPLVPHRTSSMQRYRETMKIPGGHGLIIAHGEKQFTVLGRVNRSPVCLFRFR